MSKIVCFFDDPQSKSKLQIEMAATVDWGEPFVKACSVLEGDGPLALNCFEVIERIKQSLLTENIPNVRALSEKLTRQPRSHLLHEQWVDFARDCVQSGIDHFNRQLSNSLKLSTLGNKYSKLVVSSHLNNLQPCVQLLHLSTRVCLQCHLSIKQRLN